MTKNKTGERALVNQMIKTLKKNSPNVYVHVDRDSGGLRHTASGWDFLIVYEGKTVFFECKVDKGKLSEWQKFVRIDIQKARGRYKVLRFMQFAGSKEFLIADGDSEIKSADINAEWLVAQ